MEIYRPKCGFKAQPRTENLLIRPKDLFSIITDYLASRPCFRPFFHYYYLFLPRVNQNTEIKTQSSIEGKLK